MISTRSFLLAGNATFTVQSLKSENHFTFKVRKGKKEGAPHFVSVLTGCNNETDFSFLGTIFDGETFRHGRNSPIAADAPSAEGFAWAWKNVDRLAGSAQAKFLPSGKCCRCGRKLTTPESVEKGIGPECEGRL